MRTAGRAGGGTEAPPAASVAGPDAQLAFLRSSLPAVHGYLVARCADPTLVEDLLGETLLAAAAQLRRAPDTALSTAWLLTVAHHKYVDEVRRSVREDRRVRTAGAHLDVAGTGDDDFPSATRERTLAALASLPTAQRGVLVLHYVDELPVAEVADAIGRSLHATESLLARARKAFRTAFEHEEVEG